MTPPSPCDFASITSPPDGEGGYWADSAARLAGQATHHPRDEYGLLAMPARYFHLFHGMALDRIPRGREAGAQLIDRQALDMKPYCGLPLAHL